MRASSCLGTMRSLGVVVMGGLLVLQVALACGGRSHDDKDAGESRAGMASRGGHAGAGGAAGGGGDAGSGGSYAGQAGGPPSGSVELRDAVVYANCTPGVQGDPILAFWTAVVSSAEGHEQAKLKSATLRVLGPNTVTQHLVVEPPNVDLEGGDGSAEQRKVDADVPPPSTLCFDCQSTTWTLDVEFDVGRAMASGDFACPS